MPGFAVALMVALLPPIAAADEPHAKPAEHPRLIMTKAGVERIRAELGTVPLFDAALASVRAEVDAEIEHGIDTPIPRDFSGGYTHERHKRNYFVAQKAGALFQILQDEKYAAYVRDMLFQYEAMYKDLPLHPQERSYARGKLFWQCLNDSNWLLYMSQAYDAIYEWLSATERKRLEDNLFRPFADHISIDSPQFFNRVHNHSTWGSAAVGMLGLVISDDELVERALYGIGDSSLDVRATDDDGGFIRRPGQEAGFFANLAEPFSPDGYYTEGPYYQRYAMYPFLVFAQALNNVRPDHQVFQYRGGVLLKAVDALLNLSDADGEFFPLNDAQKGMSFRARELVTAVDVAYHVGERDPRLLSIAEEQGEVLLDDAGLSVALAVRDGKTRPFEKKSVNLSDGPDGEQGGVGVLRHGDEDLTLVFKYTSQGLSHGHYDKLSMSLYERGAEVLQDYGLVRFVNIEQKGGGNYLPENATWAKQTIAHNTLTVNETSHFGGRYEVGSRHHSNLMFFDASDPNLQIVSAGELNAYPGTEMRRTMALIKRPAFEKAFLLDVLKVSSGQVNQYDLPFHFIGQLIDASFEYDVPGVLRSLGEANGYQHLYLEGKGTPSRENARVSWLGERGFYTLTAAVEPTDVLMFARLGANDPDFNLRRDAAILLRRPETKDTVFASIVEPHGSYSPVSERVTNPNSRIAKLSVVLDDADYTAVAIEETSGSSTLLIVATDASISRRHRVEIADRAYRWSGPYHYAELE